MAGAFAVPKELMDTQRAARQSIGDRLGFVEPFNIADSQLTGLINDCQQEVLVCEVLGPTKTILVLLGHYPELTTGTSFETGRNVGFNRNHARHIGYVSLPRGFSNKTPEEKLAIINNTVVYNSKGDVLDVRGA